MIVCLEIMALRLRKFGVCLEFSTESKRKSESVSRFTTEIKGEEDLLLFNFSVISSLSRELTLKIEGNMASVSILRH